MIRPLTIATFLLACGSGLYLYQSKHEVQLLDRTIERTVHETGALREQSRLLAAEWTMLNDPERLRQFSDTYLSLKTITPSQFTSLADLGNRLPAPRAEPPAHGADEPEPEPVATEIAPGSAEAQPTSVATEVLPVPPMPAVPPAAVASVGRSTDTRTALARPAVVESLPRPAAPEPRVSEQHVTRMADTHAEVRPPAVPPPPRPIVLVSPRPLPVTARAPVSTPMNVSPAPTAAQSGSAMVASSGPYSGSLLGMAHGSVPSPVPRPTPVSASYNAN